MTFPATYLFVNFPNLKNWRTYSYLFDFIEQDIEIAKTS